MDTNVAVKALSALAQPTRLQTFRYLMQRANAGVPAGQLADALAVPHNTMSSHLSILVNAQLLTSQRVSRSILYRVDHQGLRDLLGFLLEDCCQGQPDLCNPFVDSLLPDASR